MEQGRPEGTGAEVRGNTGAQPPGKGGPGELLGFPDATDSGAQTTPVPA